jgi:hypothetical protein
MVQGRRKAADALTGHLDAAAPQPEALPQRRRHLRHFRRYHVGERFEADGRVDERDERLHVHVVEMVRLRDRDVAQVASYAYVCDAFVERETVQRRMRLDETAMCLRVEIGHHRLERSRRHV